MGDEARDRSQRALIDDELKVFRSYLRWICVDQSNAWTASLSWSIFVLFTIAIPVTSHFVLACRTCDRNHHRPSDGIVQLSLSSVATLSFLCLTKFVKEFGIRRLLFLDELRDDSEQGQRNYTRQFNRSLKLISVFLLPCFLAEIVYKIGWYVSGASQIPFFFDIHLSGTAACFLELSSWLYRTTVTFLVCILFRLTCHRQILRLQGLAKLFRVDSDAASLFSEYLRMKRDLRIISHRFRAFIIWYLILITGSQFASLLHSLRPNAIFDVELGVGTSTTCYS